VRALAVGEERFHAREALFVVIADDRHDDLSVGTRDIAEQDGKTDNGLPRVYSQLGYTESINTPIPLRP
jgi:hypothetical protein